MLSTILCTLCLTMAEPMSTMDKLKQDYDMEWTVAYGKSSYFHVDLSDKDHFEITFTKHF